VHRVAAKVAQEILVLFQNRDIDTSARQQEAAHHAGWTAAGNDTCGRNRFQPFSPLALPSCPVSLLV